MPKPILSNRLRLPLQDAGALPAVQGWLEKGQTMDGRRALIYLRIRENGSTRPRTISPVTGSSRSSTR